MLWWLLAWLLDRAQLKLGLSTYGGEYSGIGCIDSVLARTAPAPMAHRVLVPWIVGIAERLFPKLKPYRLPALYEPLKIALLGLVLWATARALGTKAALVVAAALPATFLFDYWDWAGETAGLALALSGNWSLAMAGGVLAVLSRPETAGLVPIVYWLQTGELGIRPAAIAIMQAMLLTAVLLWAGARKPLYCSRLMWRQNWRELRGIGRNRPVYMGEMAMSLLVTVLTIVTVLSGKAGATWPAPLAILAAGWVFARASETRVFASCLLWVSLMFVGGQT